MSADTQVSTANSTSSIGDLVLNIPIAQQLKPVEASKQDTHVEIVKQQAQIIESAFQALPAGQTEVSVELDRPLTSELWKQISKQGYNIYQSMSYDSTDTKNHSGKYKVLITTSTVPHPEISQALDRFNREMNSLLNYTTFPFFSWRRPYYYF